MAPWRLSFPQSSTLETGHRSRKAYLVHLCFDRTASFWNLLDHLHRILHSLGLQMGQSQERCRVLRTTQRLGIYSISSSLIRLLVWSSQGSRQCHKFGFYLSLRSRICRFSLESLRFSAFCLAPWFQSTTLGCLCNEWRLSFDFLSVWQSIAACWIFGSLSHQGCEESRSILFLKVD